MYRCKVAGKSMFIEDLPVGVIEEIRTTCGLETVVPIFTRPALEMLAGPMLVRHCAAHLGVDPPEELTVRSLLAAFEYVEEDLPQEFTDGVPPEGAEKSTG